MMLARPRLRWAWRSRHLGPGPPPTQRPAHTGPDLPWLSRPAALPWPLAPPAPRPSAPLLTRRERRLRAAASLAVSRVPPVFRVPAAATPSVHSRLSVPGPTVPVPRTVTARVRADSALCSQRVASGPVANRLARVRGSHGLTPAGSSSLRPGRTRNRPDSPAAAQHRRRPAAAAARRPQRRRPARHGVRRHWPVRVRRADMIRSTSGGPIRAGRFVQLRKEPPVTTVAELA